jgi:hypothetical protein
MGAPPAGTGAFFGPADAVRRPPMTTDTAVAATPFRGSPFRPDGASPGPG